MRNKVIKFLAGLEEAEYTQLNNDAGPTLGSRINSKYVM